MFTGLITHLGTLEHIETTEQGLVWTLDIPGLHDLALGESLAIDGVCLTVMRLEGSQVSFELSPQTLRCTRAGLCDVGAVCHVERALAVGDRLGGHWLTGHVDEVVTLQDVRCQDNWLLWHVSQSSGLARACIMPKGSVALNGVSLTVNAVSAEAFEVMIIPHTQKHTHFGSLRAGDSLNIEYDWMLKALVWQSKGDVYAS